MRIFHPAQKTHTSQQKKKRKKKKAGSLFQPVKDKEPYNLRRWKNDDWRGKVQKAGIMETYKRVTPPAAQDSCSWVMPVPDMSVTLKI